ncbi:MAG TPA: hypothetical protein VKT28_12280 [Puia sp.]|nr:hypothetical protein [Puia sp.]
MWKLIDSDVISKELKIGHIISESNSSQENFEIMEIRQNGNITAAKMDDKKSMIIFPKEDLVDANWWVMG